MGIHLLKEREVNPRLLNVRHRSDDTINGYLRPNQRWPEDTASRTRPWPVALQLGDLAKSGPQEPMTLGESLQVLPVTQGKSVFCGVVPRPG